jgi:uncharacterized SAM-binding protein YcdF (DUF218 family)
MEEKSNLWGLLRRRAAWLPTWRGWLAILLIFAALALLGVHEIHPFLAVNKPLPGGLLVVEGWAPDYALAAAKEEFERNRYAKLFVTGGPLEWGAPLSKYKTYAERGTAVLLKLGMNTNDVQAVPAGPVGQDRTYTAAASLAKWLQDRGISASKIHLISEGPHARRSWLLCRKAFGKGVAVGVTAIPIKDYDQAHWWRSSAGVRGVVDETVAYVYARFFFWPHQ